MTPDQELFSLLLIETALVQRYERGVSEWAILRAQTTYEEFRRIGDVYFGIIPGEGDWSVEYGRRRTCSMPH